jgi:hypothetical protein
MNSQSEDEMTPELKDALAALPREREPGALLEERTVRALRAQGLLAAVPARRIHFPGGWMAGAAAACLALFSSGVAVGEWMAMRASQEVIATVQAGNARQAALMVQQTGSAYVTALAQLQQVSDSANPAQRKQARDVAVQALRAAANELVRLAPDDPVASGILAGFDREQQAAQRTPQDSARRQTEVVWY